MTPMSAEIIAAPAALMLLLALIWYRRHRDTRVATVENVSEDDFDDRFKRFMSTGRRRARKDQRVADDAATTGVIPVAAIETTAADAPAPAADQAVSAADDAVFGPTTATVDEPDWDAMRLPHPPEPRELAHETAPEILAPPVTPASYAREDELITRPGWPLPGDLEAWESADLAPTPAPTMPEPAFGQWAEVAAARAEEPTGTEGADHHAPDAGSETIVLGAPYPAPAMSPPTSFAGAMEPPAGSLAEPPFTSFGDGVDALGQPARPASPSTDPSFWEVGPAAEPAAAAPEHIGATNAEAIETWPPQAPASAASVWGAGAPEAETTSAAPAPEPPAEPGQIGPDDWWASEAASDVPEPTAVPDARSLPSMDTAGIKRPEVAAAPSADADWWDVSPAAQPAAATEDWWTTPASASPYGDLSVPVTEPAPSAAAASTLVGSTAVATGAAGTAAGAPGARVLPRLDASAQNRQTAGRFAVGGSAVAPGDGAFTRVRFRAPLDRPILGWAIGDGPHHAPGTLVLIVDAVLNCSTAGLSVLQEDTDPARPDGFTLSLSSDGPGPFAVSGSYYVVTG
jgi:hypothetical protein